MMWRQVNFVKILTTTSLICLVIFFVSSLFIDKYPESIVIYSKLNVSGYTSHQENEPTIESLLFKFREETRKELASYNFSKINGVKEMTDLVIQNGGNPVRSIIVSSWRSGSTFLGETLNSVPGTFHHHEPLSNYEKSQIMGPPQSTMALKQLKKLLKCDYSEMEDNFVFLAENQYLIQRNSRLWKYCKLINKCLDPVFTENICSLAPFQSMKLDRIRLKVVKELLEDPELNVKLILLVRDPRAVLLSRQHDWWCKPFPVCFQPSLVCADMVSDYVAATQLIKIYPDRLRVLRYEELALDPQTEVKKLLEFTGIGYIPQVHAHVKSHTTMEVPGRNSTFRVSEQIPFKWKQEIDYSYLLEIQSECKTAMSYWGYLSADNETHLRSETFYPITDYHL